MGRSASFGLDSDYAVAYGYDDYNRFSSVSSAVSSASFGVEYGYLANSSLIGQRTTDQGLQTTFSYESTRDLIFSYDYMSRRLGKAVYKWDESSTNWAEQSASDFVYDGWLLVKEQSASGGNMMTNFFTYGLDLSGSLQGAGGVGGLLSAVLGTNSVCYTADGNGNISEIINCETEAIDAHYEYSPFGEQLVAVGPLARDNPFRFSTKYTDNETRLVYYGYRYYSPGLGRWVSRDPLGEKGWFLYANNPVASRLALKNIFEITDQTTQKDDVFGFEYAFLDNSPLNQNDVLGLSRNEWHCCSQFMHDWSAYNSCYDNACRQRQECEEDMKNRCSHLTSHPINYGVCIFAGIGLCRIPFGLRVGRCPGPTCSWPGASKKSGC